MKTDETQGKYDVELVKRENAALRKYAAIQKATEEKIGCQKIYVDIAGGIEEAFILDELIFFTLPRPETGKSGLRVRKEGLLWMAVSRAEWWDRKRITAKQADGAIERLIKKNLIYKDIFLFNKQATTHLRLNVAEFFRRYSEELEKENPPEDESDTSLKDISDLYEMMGIPVKDTPEGIPDGEAGIPVKEEASLNGDSINSPDTTLTQPPLKIKEGATPARQKPPKANDFPSNVLYREVTEKYPAKASWHTVLKNVFEVSKRLGREPVKEDLLPFYEAWVNNGWNQYSVNWLEYAVKGELPKMNGAKNSNGKHPPPPVNVTDRNQELARKSLERNLYGNRNR